MKTRLLTLATLATGCVVDSEPIAWSAASASDFVLFTTFYSWVAITPLVLGLALVASAHFGAIGGEIRVDHRRPHR